jgi:hypothetical protein
VVSVRPGAAADPRTTTIKKAAVRLAMRERGFRHVQMWVPDVRSENFRQEAQRQAWARQRLPSFSGWDADALAFEPLQRPAPADKLLLEAD